MAIAAGSKSGLSVKEESTFNVFPTSGAFLAMPLRSETLSESIEEVLAEDIRTDRQTPEVRGGNKSVGGDITTDLGATRNALLFKHLLAASQPSPPEETVSNLASSTAYVVGDIVAGTNNDYMCIRGGTTAADEDNTDLAAAAGTVGDVELSTTTWTKVGPSGIDSTDAVYKHVFTAGVNWPSVGLSFEKALKGGNSDKYIQMSGCRVNSLNISLEQQNAMSATWGILGVKSTNNSLQQAASITAVNDKAIVGRELFVGINTKTGALRPVRGGSITITNQADENVYIVGSRFRRGIVEGTRAITGTIETYFEDSTEYDYFANETEITLDFMFYTNGYLTHIYLPKVKFNGDATPKISGPGALQASFSFRAYTNNTNDIIVTLVNNDDDMFA